MGISYGMTGVVRTGEERATLVRRTYTLVLASILVTMMGSAFAFTQPALLGAVARHPFITFFISFIPLILAQRAQTSFPQNIGFVFLFTFVMGIWVAPLLLLYNQMRPGVVGQAGLLTGSSFAVLTAYAWLSRRDFSAWGGFFIVGLWVLIGTSLINLFFHSTIADTWIAGATVLVFSGLLIFDTWRIRNVYGPEHYVLAAVQIYLDLLNLFLAILRLLGRQRD